MSTTKKELLRMIESMSDDLTIDDVMAELYFREQVDQGLNQLDQGEEVPHDKVKESHSEWIET